MMATAHWRLQTAKFLATMRILPLYASFAALKYVVPLPKLARWAWSPPRDLRDRENEQQLLSAVLRAGRLTLLDRHGDCLHRSLTLYRLLSRAGADPTLMVGFRSLAGRIEGHAWVVVDGKAVADRPHVEHFEAAFCFGRDGTLVTDHEAVRYVARG